MPKALIYIEEKMEMRRNDGQGTLYFRLFKFTWPRYLSLYLLLVANAEEFILSLLCL
jgi:hypothetical protein